MLNDNNKIECGSAVTAFYDIADILFVEDIDESTLKG